MFPKLDRIHKCSYDPYKPSMKVGSLHYKVPAQVAAMLQK